MMTTEPSSSTFLATLEKFWLASVIEKMELVSIFIVITSLVLYHMIGYIQPILPKKAGGFTPPAFWYYVLAPNPLRNSDTSSA